VLPFLGPAFIASIAYIDPGNFATNMASGAAFGYSLPWVVLATDLAEFVGAALGLRLVFGLSLWASAVLTAIAAFAILALQVRGFRWLEAAIAGLVGVVVVAFALDTLKSSPSVAGVTRGMFVPQLAGGGSALLAASIVGATVMPHAIYLHSWLTGSRIVGAHPAARRKIFRFEVVDVGLAMGVAGSVNLAMLVMEGFLGRRIPLFARRAVTMVPAVVLITAGFNPTRALVLSQVLLSFGIAFALVPLVLFTRDRQVMGLLVNHRRTSWVAYLISGVIIALNVYLLS
jgi:manganese transport protein